MSAALFFYRRLGSSRGFVRKDVDMLLNTRSLLLAAGLLAASGATAMAQHNNPAGNQGSNSSVTATPGTADNKSMSGMNTGDVGSRSAAGNYSSSAMNTTTPGATGRTVVPGSTSSQAGASSGTQEQKTGSQTTGGK
jgi:hypothetical protein